MDSYDSAEDDAKPIEDVWIAPVYESSESIASLEEYIAPEPEDPPKMKLFKEGLYSPGSGEICAKYIAMSASSVFRHAYFDYPSIKDPGIEEALLYPMTQKLYPDDGQELYLVLCKEMNIAPVRIFYRGLLTEEINLRYYSVNPVGMRAMCKALARNRTVKRLDLTSNYLDHVDACYHLGQMLGDNNALTELVLSGCNIGSKLLREALYLLKTRTLDVLDLSENKIGDKGFPFLTEQIFQGAVIRRLNLRRNNLTSESLALLAEVIEFHDHTTHLDLSWNIFYMTAGALLLIRALRSSKVLVELNMSYTGLCVGVQIGALLRIETLKVLDISHNRLTTRAAIIIAKNLILAKSLQILDLSCNPFTPPEALLILLSLKEQEIKLTELRMDSIEVNKEFAEELKEIRNLGFRHNTVITHGFVLGNYTLSTPDLRVIYMKQLVELTKNKKKKKGGEFDVLKYLVDLSKDREILEIAEFMHTMKRAGVFITDEFVAGLSRCFPGPKSEDKIKPLSLDLLAEHIHRLYPEKLLTPTPPPEPEETIVKKKAKAKGKKAKGEKAKGEKAKGKK